MRSKAGQNKRKDSEAKKKINADHPEWDEREIDDSLTKLIRILRMIQNNHPALAPL